MTNAAQEALEGAKRHFQFAMWPSIEKNKFVVLKGTEQSSNYTVLDSEEVIKDAAHLGKNEMEISIEEGQTLRVTHCDVQFKEKPLV